MGEIITEGTWAGFEVIHTYTRDEAINDGVLVDLSTNFPNETRMFKWNVCCTASVWSLIANAAKKDKTDTAVYVWDVALMALNAIKRNQNEAQSELLFRVMLPLREHGKPKILKLISGPTGPHDANPVLTITLPEED